ncbi:MAG: hypothetical protein ACI8ZN_001470 [Bacteroidia bacterium]|jgi:hypothetical protein
MKQFLIRWVILIVASIGILVLIHNAADEQIENWTWGAVLFYSLLTLFLYSLSDKLLKSGSKMFITYVYGSTFIRFLFSIFFIIIYLITNDLVSKSFIFSFIGLYLLFTTFEIYHLVVKLRTEK